jgi:phage baseplate assembly protein W
MASTNKDFSILLYKVNTTSSKKDISVVTGFNKIVQQIEQTTKVNKGELMSDPYFGSNVYQYIYDGSMSAGILQGVLGQAIQYAIPDIRTIIVNLVSVSDMEYVFKINFTSNNSVNVQNNAECTIEVPLQ